MRPTLPHPDSSGRQADEAIKRYCGVRNCDWGEQEDENLKLGSAPESPANNIAEGSDSEKFIELESVRCMRTPLFSESPTTSPSVGTSPRGSSM